jgi:4-aminobutyrate aminotransferase
MATQRPRPRIVTKPPGPKAARVLAKDRQFVSPSYTRAYPLVIERGEGVWVTDIDGNRFLDLTSGVAVTVLGHAHPEVNRAAVEQIGRFTHMAGTDFYYTPQSDLAARLCEITPGRFKKKVFLTNSGTESIEAAMKLARYATRRPRFVAFIGGFHGRTLGALSLTASKAVQRERYAPLVGDVTHVPYPDPYRDLFNKGSAEGCSRAVLDYIEHQIFRRVAPPSDVAAVIVEPVQGEGGYVVPPAGFLPGLRKLCDRHGILLVADEIQTGFGHTGKWFAVEHFGVVPDILCLAKGIANGFPLGAMVARADLHVWGPGAHANTFGGNPVACAASLKTIELIERTYLARVARTGEILARKLDRIAEKFDVVGQHRGLGLLRALEIVENKKSRAPAHDLRNRIVQRCFESGLLLLGCGDSSIRIVPALTIEEPEIETAAEILEEVLSAEQKSLTRQVTPAGLRRGSGRRVKGIAANDPPKRHSGR